MTLISRTPDAKQKLSFDPFAYQNGGLVSGESKRRWSYIARLPFLVAVLALVAFVTHGQSDRTGASLSQSAVELKEHCSGLLWGTDCMSALTST